ncbi:MAG: GxxExxY protein [Vicinamibacterales bacterium]
MLAPLGRINQITSQIISGAIEVHRALGPGLLEAVYAHCLASELRRGGMKIESELKIPVIYKGVAMDCVYKMDLLVEGLVVVEMKSVEIVLPVHRAQLLTELKLAAKPAGLLLNFNVPVLKDGITRLLNRAALQPV